MYYCVLDHWLACLICLSPLFTYKCMELSSWYSCVLAIYVEMDWWKVETNCPLASLKFSPWKVSSLLFFGGFHRRRSLSCWLLCRWPLHFSEQNILGWVQDLGTRICYMVQHYPNEGHPFYDNFVVNDDKTNSYSFVFNDLNFKLSI